MVSRGCIPILYLFDGMGQVKQWNIDDLREFWQRWYFPANATLYVVGDVNMSTEELEAEIKAHFGKVPAGRMPGPSQQTYAEQQQQLLSASKAADTAPAPNQSPKWSAAEAIRYGDGELKQRFSVSTATCMYSAEDAQCTSPTADLFSHAASMRLIFVICNDRFNVASRTC